MNNPKHTKGPWHFIETGPIRKGGPKASLLANASPHIHGVCEGISDADARLIAASPEMFEFIKSLIPTSHKDVITRTEQLEIQRKARELIAKATGGSNE